MAAQVLVLTEKSDEHASHIEGLLARRGAELVMFNPTDFPIRAGLSFSVCSDGTLERRLISNGRMVDLNALAAVWIRRPGVPVISSEVVDPSARRLLEREALLFSEDLWNGLPCRKVPAPSAVLFRAEHKLSQLVVARELGLELPPTLLTVDPDEFLDFYCAHEGRIVTKVFEQACVHRGQERFHRYTEGVSTRDVHWAEDMRYCPIIVQAYVPKAVELRVTVVGDQVFAAEIHSQESNHTRYDWRRYSQGRTPHRAHHLPEAVESACLRLTEHLDVCFGAIDLILTPDGRYVFLEINPNGQFLWIEDETGLPISHALCDLLLGERPAHHPFPALKGCR